MALIDGDNGMGHLVMTRAAELAIEKARVAGVAWVGARVSNHAGPASLYARMPLAHDMIGLYFAVGNANHLPPWGGLDMLLSTNPIAVAVPAGRRSADRARHGDHGRRLRQGEGQGAARRDDARRLDDRPRRAGRSPIRSAPTKASCCRSAATRATASRCIVGLLAGTLNGAAMGKDVIDFNHDDASATNTGQAIVAIDIAAFGDVAAFKARVDTLVRDLRGSRRMPDVDRIWLPGEQSQAKRVEYARDGIPIAAALRQNLDRLAGELGIEPLV